MQDGVAARKLQPKFFCLRLDKSPASVCRLQRSGRGVLCDSQRLHLSWLKPQPTAHIVIIVTCLRRTAIYHCSDHLVMLSIKVVFTQLQGVFRDFFLMVSLWLSKSNFVQKDLHLNLICSQMFCTFVVQEQIWRGKRAVEQLTFIYPAAVYCKSPIPLIPA